MRYDEFQKKFKELEEALPEGPFRCMRLDRDGLVLSGDDYLMHDEVLRMLDWLNLFYYGQKNKKIDDPEES